MKKRIVFGIAALFLLAAEVFIALFVHDRFVRPYMGDVLAVVCVYCVVRVAFPKKPEYMSVFVFAFAVIVELVQLTGLSELFGSGSVIAVIIGGTFDFADILCYFVGSAVCFGIDLKMSKPST